MVIDPERLKPQRGGEVQQVNTRMSNELSVLLDYLVYRGRIESRSELVLKWIGEKIEEEAPGIREELSGPGIDRIERLAEARKALDALLLSGED